MKYIKLSDEQYKQVMRQIRIEDTPDDWYNDLEPISDEEMAEIEKGMAELPPPTPEQEASTIRMIETIQKLYIQPKINELRIKRLQELHKKWNLMELIEDGVDSSLDVKEAHRFYQDSFSELVEVISGVCMDCEGEGIVVSRFDSDPEVYENIEKICPRCRGAGFYYKQEGIT